MNIKQVVEQVYVQSSTIPNWLDGKNSSDVGMYNISQDIILLLTFLVSDKLLKKSEEIRFSKLYNKLIDELCNTNDHQKIILFANHIDDVYDYMLSICEENELYESCSNIKKIYDGL